MVAGRGAAVLVLYQSSLNPASLTYGLDRPLQSTKVRADIVTDRSEEVVAYDRSERSGRGYGRTSCCLNPRLILTALKALTRSHLTTES